MANNDIDQNKAIAEKFFDAMARVDPAALASCITSDFVLETSGSSVLSGARTGIEIQNIVGFMKSVLPHGAKLTPISVTAEGDRVAFQATGEATTIDGQPYNNRYLFLAKFRDGKVCRLTEYMDTLLAEQLFAARYKEWSKGIANT